MTDQWLERVNRALRQYDMGLLDVHGVAEVLIPESPTEASVEEWSAAMDAERQRQVEHGYDEDHDRAHGPAHLLNWAIDYARRGRVLEAATMMRAALHLVTPEPPSDDEREALHIQDVREAFTASDRWDGDEAEQSLLLRFIAHYSALDREIDAARAADEYNDDVPIWFQWDDESMSLVRRHRGPITDGAVDAACEAWAAEPLSWPGEHPADAGRRYMRAALEAAEATK